MDGGSGEACKEEAGLGLVTKDVRIQINSKSGQEGGRNKDQGRGRTDPGGLSEETLEQKVCTARWERECWIGRLPYGSGRVSQVKLGVWIYS